MRKTVVFRSLGLAALFSFAFVSLVLGGYGPLGQILLNGDVTIACGTNSDILAHVTAADGKRIEGQLVLWSIVVSPDLLKDSLLPDTSYTNSAGVAHTTLHVTATPGSRTIQATADSMSDRFIVDCEVRGLPPGGLPRTSVAGPAAPATPSNTGFLVAGAAVLTGFGILTLKFFRR